MSGICTSRLFDEDSMAYAREFLGPREKTLKDLYQAMKDGQYEFAAGELPFMEIANLNRDDQLPFKYLLERINETRIKGLDV